MTTNVLRCTAIAAAASLAFTLSAPGQPVPLRQATATYSQDFNGQFIASDMIDDELITGWGILRDGPQDPDGGDATHPEAFVAETLADIGDSPGEVLVFTIFCGSDASETLGLFRFSVTTDHRDVFADGKQGLGGVDPGDVSANWVVLTPNGAVGIATDSLDQPLGVGDPSLTINPDNTVSVSGPAPQYARYTVRVCTSIIGVTGLRMEVLDANGGVDDSPDLGLPTGGPGRGPGGAFSARNLALQVEKICYADRNCDGSLDLFDFLEYVNGFNAFEDFADCDGDHNWNLFDFLCFVNEFNEDCE